MKSGKSSSIHFFGRGIGADSFSANASTVNTRYESSLDLSVQPNLMEKSLRRKSMPIDTMFSRKNQSHLVTDIDMTHDFSSDDGSDAHKGVMWTKLCTGSGYYGLWNQFGFNGHGLYRFTDGLLYDGQFKDGHFHGKGRLIFQNGNEIHGYWEMGINKHMQFVFSDGLQYKKENWDYCVPPDRRYAMSEYHELKPIGKHSLLPNRHYNRMVLVPDGCYMTGDGYYNPKTRLLYAVMNKDTRPVHIGAEQRKWIIENCALVETRNWKMYEP